MIVLALILIAAAAALGFGVAASSAADDATLEVFGAGLDVTVAGVFFAGAATAAALILGLWLLKNGMHRGRRRRRELQELRHQADATPTTATERTGQAIAADDSVADQADVPSDPSTQRPTNP